MYIDKCFANSLDFWVTMRKITLFLTHTSFAYMLRIDIKVHLFASNIYNTYTHIDVKTVQHMAMYAFPGASYYYS